MPDQRPFDLGTTSLRSSLPITRRERRHSFWWYGLSGAGILLLFGLGWLVWTSTHFTQALRFENSPLSFFEGVRLVGQGLFASDNQLAGEQDGRINILLLGRAGEHYPGKNLTDTVMILSLDTTAREAALLSLPRDLLAPLPDTKSTIKLNTLYQYGLMSHEGAELVRQSVAIITGLPIHYFATIDFDGFERVIDTLGGIQVEVLRDIYDTRYPGPNYSYETFELKKGWQQLDGKTALKYARMRHGDPEGDFGRAKRQQQILQAVRDRAWSLPTFLNPITLTNLLTDLGESIDTDITPEAARRLLVLADTIDTKNITTVVVDAWKKESLLRVTHQETERGSMFALVPRSGNWKEVQTLARDLFQKEARSKRRNQIEHEKATVLIVVPAGQTTIATDLAQDLRDTFPVSTATVRALPHLEKDSGNAIIQRDEATTLYTLDSLVDRYNLIYRDDSPVTLPARFPVADLTIFYTSDMIPGLINEIPSEEMDDFAESQ